MKTLDSRSSSSVEFPDLPLTCLETAEFKSTYDVVQGKSTVIDFWTTGCVQCPDALDKMNDMACDPMNKNIQFVSIVCDSCDGAREILEKEDAKKWTNINHYSFISKDVKEIAKSCLGFSQVPFYVILNEDGSIQQMGGKKDIDFQSIPGQLMQKDEKPQEEEKSSMEFEFDMDADF